MLGFPIDAHCLDGVFKSPEFDRAAARVLGHNVLSVAVFDSERHATMVCDVFAVVPSEAIKGKTATWESSLTTPLMLACAQTGDAMSARSKTRTYAFGDGRLVSIDAL
jgi:hypothetical protein